MDRNQAIDIAKVTGIFVKLGNKRFAVASFKDASQKFRRMVEIAGTGASETPTPSVIDCNGKLLGYIAYNGRIFEGHPQDWKTTTKMLYDNRI